MARRHHLLVELHQLLDDVDGALHGGDVGTGVAILHGDARENVSRLVMKAESSSAAARLLINGCVVHFKTQIINTKALKLTSR